MRGFVWKNRKAGVVSYRLRRAEVQMLGWGVSNNIRALDPVVQTDADRVQFKTSRNETRMGRLGGGVPTRSLTRCGLWL